MSASKRAVGKLLSVFSWRLALPAVIINTALVLHANSGHAVSEYLRAGAVQVAVSALSTAYTGGLAQRMAAKYISPWLAYAHGSGRPAAVTFALAALGHWLNGTPEFWWSCGWVTFVSATTSFAMNVTNRNRERLPNLWVCRPLLWLIKPPKSDTKSD